MVVVVKIMGPIPKRAHSGDAGFDICSTEFGVLAPNLPHMFHTSIYLEIPKGYCGLILPRSGLATQGIMVANSPGLIDEGYRGEVCVILANVSKELVNINKGDRIAQLMIVPTFYTVFESVSKLEDSERGQDGFGSTGN